MPARQRHDQDSLSDDLLPGDSVRGRGELPWVTAPDAGEDGSVGALQAIDSESLLTGYNLSRSSPRRRSIARSTARASLEMAVISLRRAVLPEKLLTFAASAHTRVVHQRLLLRLLALHHLLEAHRAVLSVVNAFADGDCCALGRARLGIDEVLPGLDGAGGRRDRGVDDGGGGIVEDLGQIGELWREGSF